MIPIMKGSRLLVVPTVREAVEEGRGDGLCPTQILINQGHDQETSLDQEASLGQGLVLDQDKCQDQGHAVVVDQERASLDQVLGQNLGPDQDLNPDLDPNQVQDQNQDHGLDQDQGLNLDRDRGQGLQGQDLVLRHLRKEDQEVIVIKVCYTMFK